MLKEYEVPPSFLIAYNSTYLPNNFILTGSDRDDNAKDYHGYFLKLSSLKFIYRESKSTPKKMGQFVTFWQRDQENDPIRPFDFADSFDFFIIFYEDLESSGQFLFPKKILLEKKIISNFREDGFRKGGKRGFRVYTPWENLKSSQAKKTQEWQKMFSCSTSS